jgi:hypothetical protein
MDLNLSLYNQIRQRAYASDLENVAEEHMMQYKATSMGDKPV